MAEYRCNRCGKATVLGEGVANEWTRRQGYLCWDCREAVEKAELEAELADGWEYGPDGRPVPTTTKTPEPFSKLPGLNARFAMIRLEMRWARYRWSLEEAGRLGLADWSADWYAEKMLPRPRV